MDNLIHADCLDATAAMDAESIDAIVTDPPYGLGFMGKNWDHGVPGVPFWADMLRIAKPGAHLLAFGGTRTVHRLAAAIEDAGWEIRDMLVWGYASGFPKSLDVSKAIDKAAGAEREVVGRKADPRYNSPRNTPVFSTDRRGYDDGTTAGTGDAGDFTAPATADAEKWNGWGTALKPAWEPIVMARKPLRGTVAANVLRHGTGALNIDGTRIEGEKAGGSGQPPLQFGGTNHRPFHDTAEPREFDRSLGRWPANVILTDHIFDGGVEGVVGGGETGPAGTAVHRNGVFVGGYGGGMGALPEGTPDAGYGDSGTYSRFFLVPKSSRSDREPTDPSFAYLLHREKGECDKLGAWDERDQRLAERMDSTSPGRATFEAIETGSLSSDTSPSGKPPTDPSPLATRSTTSTATSKTTGSTTSFSLIPPPTNGSIPGANSETESGGNPAMSAASSSLWASETGTSPDRDGRSTVAAARATSRSWSSRNNCGVCGRRLPRVSTHPTQKPTALMRHLVRLVTPPGGTVLDPFLGSGTTALACEMEGFAWIGIEKEAEYVAITEARLNGTQMGLGLVG